MNNKSKHNAGGCRIPVIRLISLLFLVILGGWYIKHAKQAGNVAGSPHVFNLECAWNIILVYSQVNSFISGLIPPFV